MEQQRKSLSPAEKAARRRKKQLIRRRRKIFLAVSSILVFVIGVGGTAAFLITNTSQVKNEFTPSKVTCSVEEKFNNIEKTDVTIKNTGDTTAFIRAAVIVTWQNEQGKIHAVVPTKGQDYIIEYAGVDSGWTPGGDGFWYYSSAVAPGNETAKLIESCKPVSGKAPEGYTLHVEIIANAIQSSPYSVAAEAWDATVQSAD